MEQNREPAPAWRQWLLGTVSVQAELEQALKQINLQRQQAYARFNSVTDPDLIAASIYEIQALTAEYASLLRQRKQLSAQREE